MRLTSALLFSGLLLCGQEKCRVAGQVVNSVTNEPVRKSRVTLTRTTAPGGAAASVITDSGGRFAFPDLDAGGYTILTQRDDFEYQEYPRGGRTPQGGSFALAPGDEKRDIVIRLVPLGTVSGRIVDEDGDPIRQVQVNLMAYQFNNGRRQLVPRSSGMTNDLGEYRLFEVRHGRYYLKANKQMMGGFGPGPGVDESYASSFHPGSADVTGASLLEIAAGQQMRGVDFTLHRLHVATLRGRVVNPVGGPSVSLSLSSITEGWGSSSGINDPDGKFEIHGVSPGSYVLTAQAFTDEKKYSARFPIQVGPADIDGIEMHLLPPMELTGHVRIEGKSEVQPQLLVFNLESKSLSSSPFVTVKQDGSLRFKDLEPDVYYIGPFNLQSLYLKSVRLGDADVTDTGIDLTRGSAEGELTLLLSANIGQVEGTVENDNSEPVVDAMVTLMPLTSRRILPGRGVAVTDSKGHFSFGGIDPGRYRLFAWDQIDEDGSVYDRDFVQPFESMGQAVDVQESGKESVHLKLIHNPAAE